MDREHVLAIVAKLEADVAAFNRDLKKTVTGVDDSSRKIEGMGKRVGDYLKGVADKAERLGTKLKSVGNEVSGLGRKAVGAALAVAGAITGLSVAVVKIQSNFETAFSDVLKTVNATEEEFASLREEILRLSTKLPIAPEELARLMSVAGQLGVQGRENLVEFTETAARLGMTTDMSSEEAIQGLSALITITQSSQKEVSNLGSALNTLGANSNAGERDILAMSTRIAGAGHAANMSTQQILALSTALAGTKVEAEMGGTAISKLLANLSIMAADTGAAAEGKAAKATARLESAKTQLAQRMQDRRWTLERQRRRIRSGQDLADYKHQLAIFERESAESTARIAQEEATIRAKAAEPSDLEVFAKQAGVTAEKFREIIKANPYEALRLFLKGLDDARARGENLNVVLSQMGMDEFRLRDAVLRLASAHGQLTSNLELANNAFAANSSLTDEVSKRVNTFGATIRLTWNRIKNIVLGAENDVLKPFGAAIREVVWPEIERLTKYIQANAGAIREWTEKALKAAIEKVKELGKWLRDNRESIEKWIKRAVEWGPSILKWTALIGGGAIALGLVVKTLGTFLTLGGAVIRMAGGLAGAIGIIKGAAVAGSVATASATGGAAATGALAAGLSGVMGAAGTALGAAFGVYLLYNAAKWGNAIGDAIYDRFFRKQNEKRMETAMGKDEVGGLNTAYTMTARARNHQIELAMQRHNISRDEAAKMVDDAQKALAERRKGPTPAPAPTAAPQGFNPLSREGFVAGMGMTPEEAKAKRVAEDAERARTAPLARAEQLLTLRGGPPMATDELQKELARLAGGFRKPVSAEHGGLTFAMQNLTERSMQSKAADIERRIRISGASPEVAQAQLGELAQIMNDAGRQGAEATYDQKNALIRKLDELLAAIKGGNPMGGLSAQAQAIMP